MRHILKLHRDLDVQTLQQSVHDYTIETFNPARHKQEWLNLNNLVFSHHPDQGNWAMEDLENRMQEPWFDPQGFFLSTQNGMVNGFVWTKIHQDLTNQDPAGELFVVGTHPDYAGKGIARALSIASINYFVNKGLKHAILYVDADNERGLKLYSSLGFN
jgi:mycothiol synthase